MPVVFGWLKRSNSIGTFRRVLVVLVKLNTWIWYRSYGIKRGPASHNEITLLCFDRAIFDKDLIEIAKRTSANLLIFENQHYTLLANSFLAEGVRDQMEYFKVHDSSKEHLYRFILQIFARFKHDLGFDCILNSNIIYYQDHEWAKVARESKVPFLTLCKEVPATKKNEKVWISDWKDFPYYGHGIAVYSDWTKEILRDKCNVGEEVPYRVVGCPRTDAIYDICSSNNYVIDQNKYVVFFDFIEYGKKRLWESSIKGFLAIAEKYNSGFAGDSFEKAV